MIKQFHNLTIETDDISAITTHSTSTNELDTEFECTFVFFLRNGEKIFLDGKIVSIGQRDEYLQSVNDIFKKD